MRSSPLIELTSQTVPEAAHLSTRSNVRTIKIDIFQPFLAAGKDGKATAITALIDVVFYIV